MSSKTENLVVVCAVSNRLTTVSGVKQCNRVACPSDNETSENCPLLLFVGSKSC